jgi:tetratricopeptide (TPR) repeat protein
MVPDDWRLLSARARLALAGNNYQSAIALGDSSLGRHLDPATLATVGDAWEARGDSVKAEDYYRAMEASTQAPRGGFHRAWYLALLDHDRRVDEVLRAVTRDLESRRDVYGYDLLAWALFKAGRFGEARAAMANALVWGTEDPMLQAHARTIEAAR